MLAKTVTDRNVTLMECYQVYLQSVVTVTMKAY